MLRKLQIRLAFWLLRRSIQPPRKRVTKSAQRVLVGDRSDPCHLFTDAVDSTLAQIDTAQATLEELALLWVDQMDILEACRIQNPE
jgi:class 3 adenylate cyclase